MNKLRRSALAVAFLGALGFVLLGAETAAAGSHGSNGGGFLRKHHGGASSGGSHGSNGGGFLRKHHGGASNGSSGGSY